MSINHACTEYVVTYVAEKRQSAEITNGNLNRPSAANYAQDQNVLT